MLIVEIPQTDEAAAELLQANEFTYKATYHDIDKRSPTYGQRIDLYRKQDGTQGESLVSLSDLCLETGVTTLESKGGRHE